MGLDDLLNYDAIDEAERMTGGKVTDKGFAREMALANHLDNSHKLRKELLAVDDTVMSDEIDRYLRIAREIGFVPVLDETMEKESVSEKVFVMKKAGALLFVDTFRGRSVNDARLYYNWKTTKILESSVIRMSGTWSEKTCSKWSDDQVPAEGVWIGDSDVRVALRHRVAQLEAAGSFIEPWEEPGHVYLRSHADQERDIQVATASRISRLPEEVRRMMALPQP